VIPFAAWIGPAPHGGIRDGFEDDFSGSAVHPPVDACATGAGGTADLISLLGWEEFFGAIAAARLPTNQAVPELTESLTLVFAYGLHE
jgi:hypothetical protein